MVNGSATTSLAGIVIASPPPQALLPGGSTIGRAAGSERGFGVALGDPRARQLRLLVDPGNQGGLRLNRSHAAAAGSARASSRIMSAPFSPIMIVGALVL